MNFSEIVILSTFVAWIVYDLYCGRLSQPTLSMVLRDWGAKWNFFAALIGFLVGHWFFPREHVDISGWGWTLPVMASIFIFDLLWHRFGKLHRPWFRYSGLWFLIGIPVGTFLWGQGY